MGLLAVCLEDARERPGQMGKWTKPPYRADGRQLASTTDPASWSSFNAVMRSHQGDADLGIGFAFTNTPYCGLDFDHCADDGVLHPGAVDRIRKLQTYTEWSPSGSGIHAIARATLDRAFKWSDQYEPLPWGGGFEAYDTGRYFTFTGQPIEIEGVDLTEIGDRQSEVVAVVDECRQRKGDPSERNFDPRKLGRLGNQPRRDPIDFNIGRKEGEDRGGLLCLLGTRMRDRMLEPEIAWMFIWGYNEVLNVPPKDESHVNSAYGLAMKDRAEDPDTDAVDYGDTLATFVYIGAHVRLRNAITRKLFEAVNERLLDQPYPDEAIERAFDGRVGDKKDRKRSQATRLVEMAADAECFHDRGERTYASLIIDGQDAFGIGASLHRETWSLHSKGFKAWLARRYFKREGDAPDAQALRDAVGTLEGKALFDGACADVHVRLAEHDGAVYLDLGDPDWTAIQITGDGWQGMAQPPVRFRRPPGMKALSMPVAGGDLDDLRPLVNVEDDDDWMLFVSVLLAALRPCGPYPVMLSTGEHGSAKSSASRVLRALVDPHEVDLRALPRSTRDLAIAARSSWVLPFDNISWLSDEMSDALCRLSTGGGFATRALYSDDEEMMFSERRPVALNGMTEVVNRPDLLDRAVLLQHPVIDEDARLTEAEFNELLAFVAPSVLGALLRVVAGGLARLDAVSLDKHPRMADFARWIVACSPSLGWPETGFLDAYATNRETANACAMDASPVAPYIIALARRGFLGNASELLAAVREKAIDAGADVSKRGGMPQSPRGMRGALDRIVANLRVDGVVVELPEKTDKTRTIHIWQTP